MWPGSPGGRETDRTGDRVWVSTPTWARAALSHPVFTGLSAPSDPWPTWWPSPRPKASSCALTGPRPRSAGHGRTMLGGGRLSRARSSRTPSRSPPSATAAVGRCGRGRCGQVGCTTRRRSRPRGSRSCCGDTTPSTPRSMPATGGLAKAFSGRVHAPPTKPAKDAPPEELEAWQQARKQQSSQRICVEHANAEHKQWRALQRWIGRREHYAETHLAIAGLVSDRAARR